jgi:hypothetical protein
LLQVLYLRLKRRVMAIESFKYPFHFLLVAKVLTHRLILAFGLFIVANSAVPRIYRGERLFFVTIQVPNSLFRI